MKQDLELIRMSDIQPEEVQWLWYPYIPLGKLTVIQGDPGEGKTTFVLAVIAALTKGEALPEREPLDPALIRPGRFDRHISVPAPDLKGREEILKVLPEDERWYAAVIVAEESVTEMTIAGGVYNTLFSVDMLAASGKLWLGEADEKVEFPNKAGGYAFFHAGSIHLNGTNTPENLGENGAVYLHLRDILHPVALLPEPHPGAGPGPGQIEDILSQNAHVCPFQSRIYLP